MRASHESEQSGDFQVLDNVEKRSASNSSRMHRGQKRRSSTQTVLTLLRQGIPDDCSAPLSQRQNKRWPAEQENTDNNNSLVHSDTEGKSPHAHVQHKKFVTNDGDGTRNGKKIDDVLESIADGGEFKCGQCKTTFAQRSLLNNHLCSRMPCKPYRCGHCQEAFAQPRELRMHAVIHVSEKPFKCGYCLRAFSGATTLNNHVRTHTGEKPFLCEVCGSSFSQAFQLSRHRRICMQSSE